MFLQHQKGKTLEQVLQEIGGMFTVVTRKQQLNHEEVLVFIQESRNKHLNDFNIASLIKSEQGFLTAYMK